MLTWLLKYSHLELVINVSGHKIKTGMACRYDVGRNLHLPSILKCKATDQEAGLALVQRYFTKVASWKSVT